MRPEWMSDKMKNIGIRSKKLLNCIERVIESEFPYYRSHQIYVCVSSLSNWGTCENTYYGSYAWTWQPNSRDMLSSKLQSLLILEAIQYEIAIHWFPNVRGTFDKITTLLSTKNRQFIYRTHSFPMYHWITFPFRQSLVSFEFRESTI